MARRLSQRETLTGWLFASPWALGMVLFVAGPVVASLVISFLEWNLLETPRWVGWANYRRLVTDDPLFYKSLNVTLLYTAAAVPLGMALSLALALALARPRRGQGLFRTIFFLPTVLSGVAAAMLWNWIFNADFGLVNVFLRHMGITGPEWLASERWALPALIIMSLWGMGGTMVIYIAGLQGIPRHLYESAAIDGAGPLRQFWHVTLPMLSPVLFFTLIMGIIGSFQVFTQAYVMTGGGPNYATFFYALYLFQQAIDFLNMGYASAMAWILFAIIMALTGLQFYFSKHWVYYEETGK
ncbi:MAG: sugar ABC transporter permease [Candidatus Sumerlaeota bacterium]|nr:sugar ABC transporter permease [Candidatus Sumerlaeota bacterium]